MGSASGVGKSTICEYLLAQLLLDGFQPEQLAYIKPMTQCTDKQAVTVFCERKGISHQGLGNLVFKKGFSKDFIDGLTKSSALLMEDILAEIDRISENKDIVIVDGIGGPSTGSIVGVSNVDIALSLEAPVLFVGTAGIGAAIDDTILAVSFMQQQGIKNIALIYNKLQPSELINTKNYVSRRLSELLPNIPVLGVFANHMPLEAKTIQEPVTRISQWLNSQSLT